MKITTSTALIGAFVLAITLTGCGSSEDPNNDTSPETETSAEEGSDDHNEADVDYISGMLPHHQQATEMAGMLLEKDDVDSEVSALAEDIREAQGPEMEQMQSWLESWSANRDDSDNGDMEGMDHGDMEDMGSEAMGEDQMSHEGMMSQEDLAELEDSSGTEASRMFLEQMIIHHEGAVSSAQDHLDNGENPEALELSEQIIADQTAEIERMQSLLDTL